MENKDLLKSIGLFIGGLLVGGGVAYFVTNKIVEKKYADMAQQEIDSVKEKFTVPKDEVQDFIEKKKNAVPSDIPLAQQALNKPSLADYAKKIQSYTNYSNVDYEPERAHFEPISNAKPYVIAPNEFGDDEEYEQQELTLYTKCTI